MLEVTLAFAALSALFVWRRVRAERRAASQVPADATACPRCGASVPAGARACARCGVPLQAFELFLAPEARARQAVANDAGAVRAHVRRDLCVGAGACTAACPEPGAITLRGKLAVVDPDLCKGHGECARACPVGAIIMSAGAAANRVIVPALDAHFQTDIPGLYIVGELGGRGLIKNAVNEGRMAIEHIAARLARGGREEGMVDVAIVGAGPAGLSAGLEAVASKLTYVVLEQGTLADSVRKYPRHKVLLAEPVNIPLYGDLWIADASKEALLSVWEGTVRRAGLEVTTGRRVVSVERSRHGFVLRDSAGAVHRARAVVLAMGRRGTPRRLEVPGEEGARVMYDVAEMSEFRGRRVLVVGGGDSAVESAIALAAQDGTTVTLSYRGEAFDRVKARNREKLAAAVGARRVTVLLGSVVREIRDDIVVLDVAGAPRLLPVDDVIVRIGGTPPQAMLDALGVRMVEKELALAPEAVDA